jgi:hypothetical protein
MLALSGFGYRGSERLVSTVPRAALAEFRSFWSAGTGWGMFSLSRDAGRTAFSLSVIEGSLVVRRVEFPAPAAGRALVKLDGSVVPHQMQQLNELSMFTLAREVNIESGRELTVEIR